MAVLVELSLFLVLAFLCYARFWPYVAELRRRLKYASNIAGPRATPLVGNALQLSKKPSEFLEQILELANETVKSGEHLMRLWIADRLVVFPLDGEALKPILESNTEIVKGRDYDFFRPWLGDGILTSTGEKWKARRKMLTPAFHFKILQEFIAVFAIESQILVNQFDHYADDERGVDILPFVKRCALDIICSTAMGVKVNAQREHDSPYFNAVEQISHLGFEYSMNPLYWIQPVWYVTGKARQTDDAVKILKNFTQKVIRERRANYSNRAKWDENGKRRTAFLDMLLAMQHDNKLSDEDIQEEVDTFMFAGHDTTSTGIGWTLWCLATHPDVQDKVIEEVDRVLAKLLGDDELHLTMQVLQELKYLERCIKETMRLFAPVPFVQRQLQNDIKICGKTVPRGANCMISPILVHRNAKVFPNAGIFDVDNFLQERIAERHPYSYIPFSAGPRNCIGQKFALLEEKAVVASILRKFNLTSNLKLFENRCGSQVTLRPEHGFPIVFKRR